MSSSSSTSAADATGSTSTIVAAAKPTGHHVLKIDGYSHTKRTVAAGNSINSRHFNVGDHTWCIKYYPNGLYSGEEDTHWIGLMLDRVVGCGDAAAPVEAHFVFSFARPGRRAGGVAHVHSFPSPRGSSSWGFHKFICRAVA